MGEIDRETAARMDGIYRTQRHFYDATRKLFLLGRDRLIERLDLPPGGRVLEIGCGTGRNLILVAQRYPHALVYGFDVSRVMLETAGHSVSRAALTRRITLAEGDATAFSPQALFGVDGFDRVFVSYALSMIPGWQQVLPAAYAAASPGGELHIVDFGQQAGWPRWLRAALRAWLARFTVEPRGELEAELAALASMSGAALTFERLYSDFAHAAVLRKPLTASHASPPARSA